VTMIDIPTPRPEVVALLAELYAAWLVYDAAAEPFPSRPSWQCGR